MEYTPKTDEVRRFYVEGEGGMFADDEFDRWLKAQEAEWLASRKPEAAPSDTETCHWCNNPIRGLAEWQGDGLPHPSCGEDGHGLHFERGSQPVQVEVTTAIERNKARFDLQAVIAEARAFASTDAYRGDDGVVDGDEVLRILSQSPTDALQAHDRQVAAKALTDAANAWTQGEWANTPRRADRVADRMAASQFAGDWLRARAVSLVPGNPEPSTPMPEERRTQ